MWFLFRENRKSQHLTASASSLLTRRRVRTAIKIDEPLASMQIETTASAMPPLPPILMEGVHAAPTRLLKYDCGSQRTLNAICDCPGLTGGLVGEACYLPKSRSQGPNLGRDFRFQHLKNASAPVLSAAVWRIASVCLMSFKCLEL